VTNSHRRAGGLSPEFAILGFLNQSSSHGYELYQKLVTELGEIWHCSLSQIYNILTRLEAQGYIEGKTQAQEKRPDKRELRLTAAGRERFEIWLAELSACSVRSIRTEFITRLYFLYTRSPQSAIQMMDAQIAALQKYLATLKSELHNIDEDQVFNHLGLLLRISQLETLITWLETSKYQLPILGQSDILKKTAGEDE
jgi:PadR family transcriptional regulator, regulatory protein AphA